MWDWINERLYDEPERMIGRGQASAGMGLIMLLAGVMGWAATHMVGVVRDFAGQGESPSSLAEVFGWSPWVTFWVPESAFGLLVALGLTAFGYWSLATGRYIRRAYG